MIDSNQLRRFSPFDTLMQESLQTALEHTQVKEVSAGQVLFRSGDDDDWTGYLLTGRVELRSDADSPPLIVEAGTEAAQRPLSRLKPRRYTAIAQGPVSLAIISDEVLDQLLTVDQSAAIEVVEYEGEDPEWMVSLLRNPAFGKVPPANFVEIFAQMEDYPVHQGQAVIQQGEPGDYYYLIRDGRAQVSRQEPGGRPIVLAEIGEGDGFGEEALLSGEPRNASVTMLTDGRLMRLSAKNFNLSLRQPLVKWVSSKEAVAMSQAGAGLVDVRLEDEFQAGTLRGSINIPLYLVRVRAKTLNPKRKYVLFCQTERRSCVAAFLLSQRGLDTYVLKGGLNSLKQAKDAEAGQLAQSQ